VTTLAVLVVSRARGGESSGVEGAGELLPFAVDDDDVWLVLQAVTITSSKPATTITD